MKNAKRAKLMKQLNAAALILGILSPAAYANEAPKEGVSLEEFNKVVRNLEVIQSGNQIVFAGMMPKRCAENASARYGHRNERHEIMVVLAAECQQNFTRRDGEEMVAVSSVLGRVNLEDKSGPVVLRHFAAGDPESRARNNAGVDALKVDGRAIVIVGAEEREAQTSAAREQEAAAAESRRVREEAKRRADRLARVLNDAESACKRNDFEGMSRELSAATDLLGDVSAMLERVGKAEKAKYKRDLERATTAEEAEKAHEAFIAAAGRNGWDEDEMRDSYVAKRFEIMNAVIAEVKTGDKTVKEAEESIRDWQGALRLMNSRLFRANRQEFAKAYAELATHVGNKGDVAKAMMLYDRAASLTDENGRMEINKTQMGIYAKLYEKCLKDNPGNMGLCDRRFEAKMKQHAQAVGATLQARANGNEEAQAAYQAFQGEFAGIFGQGVSVNMNGFGTVSQMPGMLQQLKQRTYMEALQAQQAQMQQRYLQQMMGGGMPTANAGSGGLLGAFAR